MISTFTGIFKEKKFLISDVATIAFSLKNNNSLDFAPGQYLVMHVPFGQSPQGKPEGENFSRRIFSLITTPGLKEFEFLAKIIPDGVASEYFMHLNEGDEVLFQGPAGMFVMRQTQKPKLFIATGTGIAPVFSILRTHPAKYSVPFYLVWGLKTEADIYQLEELEELTHHHPHFHYFICLSREVPIESFEKQYQDNIVFGRVNKKIDELLYDSKFTIHDSEFYISGDRNIVEDIRQHLLTGGIPKESISFEKFV